MIAWCEGLKDIEPLDEHEGCILVYTHLLVSRLIAEKFVEMRSKFPEK